MRTDANPETPQHGGSGASSRPIATGGVGPFVTWARQPPRDGVHLLRTSRRQRKGLAPRAVTSADIDPAVAAGAVPHVWSRFWAPRRSGWWIAVLFMVGSAAFALGGLQSTWPDAFFRRWLDQQAIGWIFFVGSIFFTMAAYLQWLEALNNDVGEVARPGPPRPRRWRLVGWCPRNLGYMAAAIQLVGTVLFNLDTADALVAGSRWQGQDLLVWTPDVLGSICFLVASQLALMEVSHDTWSFQPASLSWWITAINLLGSVLFMVSAVVSFVEPGRSMLDPWLANFGTFAGAVCFLVGAYLLIPELFEEPDPTVAVATEGRARTS